MSKPRARGGSKVLPATVTMAAASPRDEVAELQGEVALLRARVAELETILDGRDGTIAALRAVLESSAAYPPMLRPPPPHRRQ